MTPKALDRLARLETGADPPVGGRHLVFQVEAPAGVPVAEIVAFLRGRGHAIHDGDEVFVMNLGAYTCGSDEPILDLSADVLTEEMRAAAPAAGRWPKGLGGFTFSLDSPRVLH